MVHRVDRHVGGRLRSRRESLGFSQQQLGDAVGTTVQQIQKYEGGERHLSASRLYEIARVLDVRVAFFYEGLDHNVVDLEEARREKAGPRAAMSWLDLYGFVPVSPSGYICAPTQGQAGRNGPSEPVGRRPTLTAVSSLRDSWGDAPG